MAPPQSVPPTPTIDIAKMLSSIREQTSQQTSGLGAGLKSDFWQNILSATAPPPNIIPPKEPELVNPAAKRDPRSRAAPAKLVLPPPAPSSVEKPVTISLNARDPRLSRSVGKSEPEVAPIPTLKAKTPEIVPAKEEKVWEPVREKERKPGQHSYKLHTVTVPPLNYSSYLFATQNDTKLLEDPRLKKLLSGQTPPRLMTTLPFPPELQQFLEQSDSKPKQSPPNVSPQPQPPQPPLMPQPPPTNLILASGSGSVQKSDPRLKRNIPPSAQSPVHPGGFTPPHPTTTLMDLPPNLLPTGGFTPPPPIGHPMMDMPNPLMMGFPPPPPRPMNPMMDLGHPPMLHPPMLHTHMPRGFVDPRFARLQQPMNPRRGRGNMRHQGPHRKSHKDTMNKPSPSLSDANPNEPPKAELDDKNHRKSQMNYASPLSSYDESTPKEGSAYNRRPQQNPRTSTQATPAPSTTPPPPLQTPSQSNIPSGTEPDTNVEKTDMHTEDVNSASLREVFKTIDPTASPFC